MRRSEAGREETGEGEEGGKLEVAGVQVNITLLFFHSLGLRILLFRIVRYLISKISVYVCVCVYILRRAEATTTKTRNYSCLFLLWSRSVSFVRFFFGLTAFFSLHFLQKFFPQYPLVMQSFGLNPMDEAICTYNTHTQTIRFSNTWIALSFIGTLEPFDICI